MNLIFSFARLETFGPFIAGLRIVCLTIGSAIAGMHATVNAILFLEIALEQSGTVM